MDWNELKQRITRHIERATKAVNTTTQEMALVTATGNADLIRSTKQKLERQTRHLNSLQQQLENVESASTKKGK